MQNRLQNPCMELYRNLFPSVNCFLLRLPRLPTHINPVDLKIVMCAQTWCLIQASVVCICNHPSKNMVMGWGNRA